MVAPPDVFTMAAVQASCVVEAGADDLHAGLLQPLDGIREGGLPVVDSVVVAEGHQIDAGGGQRRDHARRALEGVVLAWCRAAEVGERRLEIDPGDVALLELRRDAAQHGVRRRSRRCSS